MPTRDMCPWQQDSAVLIGLSLQWHVLHQLIGLYQKTLNNIDVMFRKLYVRSANQLPHTLGTPLACNLP